MNDSIRTGKQRRDVHGILLLDKPAGLSSNAALQQVKRLFNARKAGHTGSLDVPACGLLPICLGEATKVSGFLLDAGKRYRTVFKLGERTTTGDAKGECLQRRPVVDVTTTRIRSVLREYTGTIQQIPPMHSAIKHQGKPLYKLAYAGETVERKPRTITIYALDLMRFDCDNVEVEVACSKGTYIRTLAEDIGETLGCGAHVQFLRRLQVGPFNLTDAITLDRLEELTQQGPQSLDGRLLCADMALADQPPVCLSPDASYYLCQGQAVLVPKAPANGMVRLYDAERRFLGVGQVLDDGRIAPRRLIKG